MLHSLCSFSFLHWSFYFDNTSAEDVKLSLMKQMFVCLFVYLLQDASGHSNVLKAGKAEELKNARKRRTARKAN